MSTCRTSTPVTTPAHPKLLSHPSPRHSSKRRLHGLRVAALLALSVAAAQVAASVPQPGASADGVTAPAEVRRLDPTRFPVPEELTPNVAFWIKVYSGYDDDTVLLHDELHLGVIYAAVDLGSLSELPEARRRLLRRREIDKVKAKYRTILHNLAAGRAASDAHAEEQARVEALFASVPGGASKYSAAVGRIRTQTCLRNRFAEAIERSGVYMPTIEAIFTARGLPEELTRLPFVESLFQWNAHSKAAAGGIWQFVPGTARYYLEMELEYDERYHPLRASEAAARHLEENYEALRSWPLAITAYNHGRAGMKRAVRRVGTRDLGEIVERYRSRTFGFASRNFYAEFVAAAVVYENREHYFPGVSPLPPLEFDEFVPELYVPLAALAEGAGVDVEVLREINPALSREVWAGHLYLPRGYPLMVPAGTHDAFGAAFEALPAARKSPHQVGFRYRVRPGDTLSKIAAKFGTSVPALQRANRLSSPHRIRVGQRLLVPPAGGAAAMAPGVPGSHVVQPGETLSRIAGRYGTTVTAILAANSLRSADLIHPGQRLTIPARAGRATHVVRSGETLAAIAQRYGTTVRAIQHANRIRSHLIRPAQVLVIP